MKSMLTEIKTYCDMYNVQDVDELIFLIRAMDAAFVDEMVEKEKAKLKNGRNR